MSSSSPQSSPSPFADITVTWVDGAIFCVILVYGAYLWASELLTPKLIGTDPLLLSAIRGSLSSLLVTGALIKTGRLFWLVALLVPLPSLMFSDPFVYWAGRRLGKPLLDMVVGTKPKQRKRREQGDRLFRKYGLLCVFLAYFIPLPSTLFYIAAGEARIPFVRFFLADLAGTLLWIGTLLLLGWSIGAPAVRVAHAISKDALVITIALAVVLIGLAYLRNRPDKGPTGTTNG